MRPNFYGALHVFSSFSISDRLSSISITCQVEPGSSPVSFQFTCTSRKPKQTFSMLFLFADVYGEAKSSLFVFILVVGIKKVIPVVWVSESDLSQSHTLVLW